MRKIIFEIEIAAEGNDPSDLLAAPDEVTPGGNAVYRLQFEAWPPAVVEACAELMVARMSQRGEIDDREETHADFVDTNQN